MPQYAKKYALDSFHYMTSVKVFLAFSSLIWASSTNNKAPQIPFYHAHLQTATQNQNHPLSITQFPWKCPAGFHVWEDGANLLKSFSNESLIELVLKDLSIIHVNIV